MRIIWYLRLQSIVLQNKALNVALMTSWKITSFNENSKSFSFHSEGQVTKLHYSHIYQHRILQIQIPNNKNNLFSTLSFTIKFTNICCTLLHVSEAVIQRQLYPAVKDTYQPSGAGVVYIPVFAQENTHTHTIFLHNTYCRKNTKRGTTDTHTHIVK